MTRAPAIEHANGTARPDPTLDRLFAPRPEGYLGADAALSIPLPDGRVLWVFGDTLVGRLEGRRRIIRGMPRNSVAIQHGCASDPEAIEWTLTGPDGAWRSFFRLPEGGPADKWLWVTAGVCLDAELFLFGYGVVAAPGDCEALSFRLVDSWLLRVRDVGGMPGDWRIEASRLPFPSDGPWMCSSAWAGDGWVYLIGIQGRIDVSFRHLAAVLARVESGDLKERGGAAAFEFWTGPPGGERWSARPDALAPLFQPGPAECTVFWDAPRRRFVATTYQASRPEYLMTTAPAITGPWSRPVLVYRAGGFEPADEYLYYAFRMHPHLAAGPDDMALTYIVNPRRVAGLTDATELYYPRFLRLDLRCV
ncbi:MAG: hypothetical protein Kow0059_11370 [Candidatus Sumerlaeia bacterium]